MVRTAAVVAVSWAASFEPVSSYRAAMRVSRSVSAAVTLWAEDSSRVLEACKSETVVEAICPPVSARAWRVRPSASLDSWTTELAWLTAAMADEASSDSRSRSAALGLRLKPSCAATSKAGMVKPGASTASVKRALGPAGPMPVTAAQWTVVTPSLSIPMRPLVRGADDAASAPVRIWEGATPGSLTLAATETGVDTMAERALWRPSVSAVIRWARPVVFWIEIAAVLGPGAADWEPPPDGVKVVSIRTGSAATVSSRSRASPSAFVAACGVPVPVRVIVTDWPAEVVLVGSGEAGSAWEVCVQDRTRAHAEAKAARPTRNRCVCRLMFN